MYNGFQEKIFEDTIQSTHGDAINLVSMDLPIHKDIKLFVEKEIKI